MKYKIFTKEDTGIKYKIYYLQELDHELSSCILLLIFFFVVIY